MKNRSFLLVILGLLTIAFIASRVLQHSETNEKIDVISRSNSPVFSAPPPASIVESQSPSTVTPVVSESNPSGSQAVVVEPEMVVAPEIVELKKSVASFALQKFTQAIGLNVRAPFEFGTYELSSLDQGVLKFRGSVESGDESFTILAQKKRGVLAAIYLTDLDIKREHVRSESFGAGIFSIVTDPEGDHIFVVSDIGEQSFLVARTRRQPPFSASEVAELKALLSPR